MLRPLAYVTGHKPHGSSGSPPERGAQGKVWTRANTGPLLMSGFSPSRGLAVVQTLLGGTWGPSEGPDMSSWEFRTVRTGVRCPSVEVRTQ
jgi:hypothetical protein